ncbi:MAG: response regulator [Candidatus Omnitrophota bacterium]|nr:response regulator [Candidatus Omnitrophota bacterium]
MAEGKKILIVDDDEDLQLLYGLFLQGFNYVVVRAGDGEEALRQIEAEKPDLVILDMIMPVMDGEECLTKLRTEKKNTTPVIIASVNDKIPQELLDLGHVYTTLKKPFTMEALVEKIEGALAG